MKEFKLIVAGSRGFNDYDMVIRELNRVANAVYADREVSIVSGMAAGADRLGVNFANEFGVRLYKFPADWVKYGRSAGFIRNDEMAVFADGLLAFWDGKSRGTANMIRTMEKMGKPVHIVKY